MKPKWMVILAVLIVICSSLADEVQLKNGKTWLNVNILEKEETLQSIFIFTSKQQRIEIPKSEIVGFRQKNYDTSQKSELVDLGRDHLAVVEKFYTPMEGDSINTGLDSLLLQENTKKVKKK